MWTFRPILYFAQIPVFGMKRHGGGFNKCVKAGWGVPTLTGAHELTNGNPGEFLSRVLALARPPEFNLVVSPTNHGRSTNRTSIEQPTTNNLDG